MEYFAGLDVSMEETHVCVVDRDGKIILEARTPTAPKTIAAALAKGPSVDRVLFETGRMAPTLFHGLTALGVPVVSRCHRPWGLGRIARKFLAIIGPNLRTHRRIDSLLTISPRSAKRSSTSR